MKSAFLDKLIERLGRLDAGDVQAQFLRLATEKGLLETIFHALREGILVLDNQLGITFANRAACRMLGIPDPEQKRLTLSDLGGEMDWQGLLDSAMPHRTATREIEIFSPAHRFLEVYLAPLEAAAGANQHAGGAVLILRDVTHERQSANDMLESERLNAVILLASGVAHEIGNPLNSVGIHLQLMERALADLPPEKSEELSELLHVARGEIARLDRTLTHFLKALRPSAPDCKPLNLEETMQTTLATLAAEIEDRHIQLAITPGDHLPSAWADAGQVQRAFYNVIHNAIQAMPHGGTLDISFGCDNRHVWAAFKDDGPGIPPERMGDLFQPFSSTRKTGTGMGLVIVRGILRDHGGNALFESSSTGTRVQLNFLRDGPRMLLLDTPSSTPAPEAT